jgi:hypothetical protein
MGALLPAAVPNKLLVVVPTASLAVIIFGVIVAPVCARRPALWIAGLLLVLALFPSSSINPELRIEGGGFRIFTRYVAGALCIWDVLLLVLVGFILLRPRRFRLFSTVKPNQLLWIFVGVWALAAVNGLAHVIVWRYGYTSFRSVVQQTLPAVYFVLSYLLARTVLVNRRDINLIVRTLYVCNVVILIQGLVLLVLALGGRFPAIKGFLGIPIVLYGQVSFLTFGLNLAAAKLAAGHRVSYWDWAILVGGVFFSLATTRRMVLLFLVFNLVVIWFLATKGRFSVGRLVRVARIGLLTAAAVGLLAYLLVPQLMEALPLMVQSFDLTSEIGAESGGNLRIAQMESLFLNLRTQAPLSYVWGMGLGTYWYENVSMGLPTDRGTTGYSTPLVEGDPSVGCGRSLVLGMAAQATSPASVLPAPGSGDRCFGD